MTTVSEARLTKAEELFARRERLDTERLSDQARERQTQDQKTAHLRELRLASEAAVKGAVPKEPLIYSPFLSIL